MKKIIVLALFILVVFIFSRTTLFNNIWLTIKYGSHFSNDQTQNINYCKTLSVTKSQKCLEYLLGYQYAKHMVTDISICKEFLTLARVNWCYATQNRCDLVSENVRKVCEMENSQN